MCVQPHRSYLLMERSPPEEEMSIQVMDASENETEGKIKERTQSVTREKSILDYFKSPPDKEVLVTQKSLLHFFVKANIASSKSQTRTSSIKCDNENLAMKKTNRNGQNDTVCNTNLEIQETESDGRLSGYPQGGCKLDETIIINGESPDCSQICLENDVKDEGNEIKATEEDPVRGINYCLESGATVEDIQILNGEHEDSEVKKTLAKDEGHSVAAEDKDSYRMLSSDENVACRSQKRSNLKVKDMLNLLKEVKVSEKKEKRKKHKHRLQKQNTEDMCDVNVEPNNVMCEDSEKISEGHGNEHENGEVDYCQGNELDKDDIVKRQELKNVIQKEKEGTEKNIDNVVGNIFNKDDIPREMSYSEFLEKLNKKEEIIEVDEVNKTCVLDTIESNVKLVKEESNSVITKYFNCTSIPGREKAKGNIKAETTEQTKVRTACKSEKNNENSEMSGDKNVLRSEIDMPTKTTSQAMLCFGSDGFKIARQKSSVDSHTDQKVKSAKDRKDKEQVSDNTHKNAAKNLDLNTSESAFETPVKCKSMKRKCGQNGDGEDESETSDLTDQPESEGCRRSQRKKYKVTVFQMDEEKKTPIKIKLRRCAKSSSSGNEFEKSVEGKLSKTKTKVKQTTAQALLEKAKNRMHKTKLRTNSEKEVVKLNGKNKKTLKSVKSKQDLNDSQKKNRKKKKEGVEKGEHGNARRSSRLEGKLKVSMEEVSIDNIVISSDEEAAEISKRVKKLKKKAEPGNAVQSIKSMPVKSSKPKSPVKKTDAKNTRKIDAYFSKQKSSETWELQVNEQSENRPSSSDAVMDFAEQSESAKLAPMFLIGKKKEAASPAKPALDQEQVRQRRLFLMSGVPEELKKQTSIRQANTTGLSYPPIPTINHVQQIYQGNSNESDPKRLSVWKMGKVTFNLRNVDQQSLVLPISKFSRTGAARQKTGTCWNWKFEKGTALEDKIAERCLCEIMASNPAYPAKEMFRAFREYKLCSENEQFKTDTQELKTDMKGILSEEMKKSEAEQKNKSGRSLKLSKKEDRGASRDEAKTTFAESAQTSFSLLWTDKYYPTKASEILGNGGALKKLKDWLLEWKQVLDREARKARKLLLKKNKGKMAASKGPACNDDSDFDSDFDIDSDDSEDDMSLCNTTLLVGPHGCGKTSSVYALAQELGYKVHEVNASSSRSGRLILSQLQEATQSQQVSSQGCHTPSKKKGVFEKVTDNKEQPKSKMALSFTNLISKQNPNKDKDKAESALKKKRQKGEKVDEKMPKETRPTGIGNKQMTTLNSEDSNSQSLTHSINLSRTTLILFEEVDVAFEEDKGFLAAVQTFMSTTKVPIVLTSNKKNFSPNFEGRLEVINLKRPSVEAITSHLQAMALVENIRTDFRKLSELVNLCDRDVRRCILTLQLLVESGRSKDQNYCVLTDAPIGEKTSEKTSDLNLDKPSDPQTGNEKSDNDDLDDFVVLKGRQTKRRRILDDHDSNSGDQYSCLPLQQASRGEGQNQDARKFPVVYGFGLRCFLPGLVLGESGSTTEYIQDFLKDRSGPKVEDLITICSITGINLLHSNMHLLLPLSFSVCDRIRQICQGEGRTDKKTKKRKRIQSDLFDSEGSDGEEVVIDSSKNDELDGTLKENIAVETSSKLNNSCLMTSLSSFTSFYDTMSSLDVIRTSSDIKSHDSVCTMGDLKVQTRLSAGLDDELCNFTDTGNFRNETLTDIKSVIEARTFCKLSQSLACVKNELEKSVDITPDLWAEFTLPVSAGMDQFQVNDKPSTSLELQRAMNDIRDNLPYTLNKNHRCALVDYVPTLREICRCESVRLSANTKRRFQHYLDNINLPLKDKTMTILATTFTGQE